MRIEDLLSPDQRHYLYKDEIGDTFLLTKFGEIYLYSEDVLKVLCFRKSDYQLISEKMPTFGFDRTDEPLIHFCIDRSNLSKILAVYRTSKRFKLDGRFINKARQILGHDIIPYKPAFLKPETGDIPEHLKQYIHKKKPN